MIELNPTAESRMSAVKCMEGLRDKIEMFMKAGDLIDHTKRGRATEEEAMEGKEMHHSTSRKARWGRYTEFSQMASRARASHSEG